MRLATGLCPGPLQGSYNAPLDSLAVIRGGRKDIRGREENGG